MRTVKFIGAYIGASVFLGLLWAVLSYPDIPSTISEWVWILALALPLQLAGEFLGERFWNNKATRFVEQKTAAQSFSLIRILYGVFLLLLFTGLVLGTAYLWQAFRP